MCDGRFSGRFVFVRMIIRISRFLSKATDMRCKRRWGAMRRGSLASDEGCPAGHRVSFWTLPQRACTGQKSTHISLISAQNRRCRWSVFLP